MEILILVIANAFWFGHGILLQKCAALLLQFRIFLNRRNVGIKFSIIRQNENVIFIFSAVHTAI